MRNRDLLRRMSVTLLAPWVIPIAPRSVVSAGCLYGWNDYVAPSATGGGTSGSGALGGIDSGSGGGGKGGEGATAGDASLDVSSGGEGGKGGEGGTGTT